MPQHPATDRPAAVRPVLHRSLFPAALLFAAAVLLAACAAGVEEPATPEPEPAVIHLDQGWTPELRALSYHTPQGSQMVPYRWFLALEQPEGEGLLRDDAYLDGFRFLPDPDPAGGLNPDLLPVGFTREPPTESGSQEWAGLTCSACHTAQVEYRGQRIRIDGGPAMADMTGFFAALDESLRRTVEEDDRFDRFADRVLGPEAGADERQALRTAVADHREAMPRVPPHAGYARQDAFGAILNEVTGTELGVSENYAVADAPASFPFLWDTPRLAWVQWNGLAANPIERNIGEVYGVFGHVGLDPSRPDELFSSTARLRNLHAIEEWMANLEAPRWPEEVLGAIDTARTGRGETIYRARCESCHALEPYPMTAAEDNAFGKRFIEIWMVPVPVIGTDPKLVQNLGTRMAKTGPLAPVLGVDEMPAARLLVVATSRSFERLAHEEGLTEDEIAEYIGYRRPRQSPPNAGAYKARPLAGIWATAPYLHNGSVPNLYELLLPAAERSVRFHVGSREFDPERVGFVTAVSEHSTELDTTVPGNRNIGHEMTNDLTAEERLDLLEFLKTL